MHFFISKSELLQIKIQSYQLVSQKESLLLSMLKSIDDD